MPTAPLVSPAELQERLSDRASAPLVLDVRWQLGSDDGCGAFLVGHLPTAVYVDLDRRLSGKGRGRHPMPSVDEFEIAMADCGVDSRRPVVCYDDFASVPASRCWWLLRHFGKEDVQVLDGGYTAWRAAGLPIVSGRAAPVEEGDFEVRRGKAPVLNADEAARFAREGLLIDCRPADRYRGENEIIDPVAGHIPGAVSVPAASLMDDRGRLLPIGEIRGRLSAAGVDGIRPVATYCGSGVQACFVAMAVTMAGLGDHVPVYIGSWSDWITDPDRPVATGP